MDLTFLLKQHYIKYVEYYLSEKLLTQLRAVGKQEDWTWDSVKQIMAFDLQKLIMIEVLVANISWSHSNLEVTWYHIARSRVSLLSSYVQR